MDEPNIYMWMSCAELHLRNLRGELNEVGRSLDMVRKELAKNE